MSTSGNTSWELDRDSIVERAFALLGVPGEDNTLTATQYTDGAEALNAVIALAVTDGMPLWKRTEATLTPSETSQVYTLNNAIKVADVFIRDSNGAQWRLRERSLYDFMQLPRGTTGMPVHYTFQPDIQGGTISFWPILSDSSTVSTKTLQVIYQKEFDGVVSSTDTMDFPAYWTLALIYKTATILAPQLGVPLQDRQALKAEMKEFWMAAKDYGDEDGSFYIQPHRRHK